MANDKDGMTSRDLQESQSGGESGRFGGNMYQGQRAGEAAGGPEPSDVSAAGGSSGGGGYGRSQDAQNRQGQPGVGSAERGPVEAEGQSRGELEDELANGGRGPESVSPDDDEIARDQRTHQDRGKDEAEAEFEREQS